jgi:hypothetical protein
MVFDITNYLADVFGLLSWMASRTISRIYYQAQAELNMLGAINAAN